jgi:hypothetical protein
MDRTVSFEELMAALGGAAPPSSPAGSGGGGNAPVARPSPQPQPAAKPETKPARPATNASGGSVEGAWRSWLDAGTGVPRGLGSFLRSARVSESADGRVHISDVAAPAADRLLEPSVQQAIRDGLAAHLGRVPDLVVDEPSGPARTAARVTEAEVRDDALKALYRQEPRLQRAVEELDLELME